MKTLSRDEMKKVFGGMLEDKPCDQATCSAKSTSSKSCTCSAFGYGCLCTAIVVVNL